MNLSRFKKELHKYLLLQQLQQHVLQGGALDFFASLPEQIRGDYQTTKNALAERYSQLQNPLQAQVELARACQQPGETASDFADRLRQLGRLAHPRVAPDDPTLDASLRGLFICGLRDAGLKSVLCNKSPDSMDAAVRIAREFKSQQTALVAMQQFGTAAGAHEAMTPQVMVASSGGSGVNQAVALQSLERRMDDIQQALQQLCTDGPRRQNTGGLAEDGDGGARRGTAFVSGNRPAADADCLTRLVSGLLLFVVFSLTVLTLPVSGWWTVRRLSQWQRLVVFRLGKVLPARGPGWALVLPGIDTTQVVDLRNRSILVPPQQVRDRSILVPPQQVRDSSSLVPPQQLLTSDGAVAELGAEVLYRVCDAHTFVGSCVDPQASLRSLWPLAAITRKAPETEEAVLLSINSTLKDWGMEASSVKFSEVKVHKEAEHLSAVNPLLRQLGGMLGGGGGGGRTMVAGQAPLTASWLPPQPDGATAAPLAAGTPAPLAAGTPAPLAEDSKTAAALREAVARLPADTGLASGVFRIETTSPEGLYHVIIGEGVREVRLGPCPELTADVGVTLTSADLRQLISGQLSPAAAYSGGRLRLQGNVHLLMALGTLFREAGAGI
ncbi:Stomatin-like protein 1 [Amphibalanus amphitrite]|uniref:Stomatin-like protein 1 n=1 Tax=Amphibalanus amphitrite TaxID=1232801 RepID=A0A6A4WVQ0_AMPAM|nr:Stomatin-like protein 1 [Amphibalanus amphitrite]